MMERLTIRGIGKFDSLVCSICSKGMPVKEPHRILKKIQHSMLLGYQLGCEDTVVNQKEQAVNSLLKLLSFYWKGRR